MLAQAIIVLIFIKTSVANILDTETNYLKQKLDRNNIVNKSVWIRNKRKENIDEKGVFGDFMFRSNSLDVDGILQNNFDELGSSYMQVSPFISAYVERSKRSNIFTREPFPAKGVKKCKGKYCSNQLNNNAKNKIDFDKYKIINYLKPKSGLNDYPYQVAFLFDDNNKTKPHINATKTENNIANTSFETTKRENVSNEINNYINTEYLVSNGTEIDPTTPKIIIKHDFETETIKKIEIAEHFNKTDESRLNYRNVDDNNDNNSVWNQDMPNSNINMYKVLPKEHIRNKPITERGLVKVISMLTKTFKKIMKQHEDIREIHEKISDVNNDFSKNAAAITTKFVDFDNKYEHLKKFQDKLTLFEANIASKEKYFNNKERIMEKGFLEFENQQKKFILQQQHFYNIQRLMLAQNEKINQKQDLIAKTQNEISHRQNNFARILKKAKQLYLDNKYSNPTKLSSSIAKTKYNNKVNENISDIPQTSITTLIPTTETVKINLFSIPVTNKLKYQDDLILKEKDAHPIDDLVYKYYFNNSYIDNFMRNNILAHLLPNIDNVGGRRHIKNKRDEELKTTVLFPINEVNNSEQNVAKSRERRWINHHSKNKNKRRNRGKETTAVILTNDEKLTKRHANNIPFDQGLRKEPFLTMAQNFCKEITKNKDELKLKLCVEKSLRRLAVLEPQLAGTGIQITTPTGKPKPQDTSKIDHAKDIPTILATGNIGNIVPSSTTSSPNEQHVSTISPFEDFKLHFPDNDALELNLKQYLLTPDTEGNVYYDGSVHASELVAGSSSQGMDDIVPSMESISRMELDPHRFDVKARRKAIIRGINKRTKMAYG